MRLISLTNGGVTKVSNKDFKFLSQWGWHKRLAHNGKWYVVRSKGSWRTRTVCTFMARAIKSCPPGLEVDHKNGDTLDNRRSNLRNVPLFINRGNFHSVRKDNTTGYCGVFFTPYGKYYARIRFNGRAIHLGTFSSKKDAALAYNQAARRLRGKWTYQNKTN